LGPSQIGVFKAHFRPGGIKINKGLVDSPILQWSFISTLEVPDDSPVKINGLDDRRMDHVSVGAPKEKDVARTQLSDFIGHADYLGIRGIIKPGSRIIGGISAPGNTQGPAEGTAQIQTLPAGDGGENMPYKAGTIHARPAHTIKVIVHVRRFEPPARNQHIGLVGKPVVGSGLHSGYVEEVQRNGPGSLGYVKDNNLFPAVPQNMGVLFKIFGIQDLTNRLPEGCGIPFASPKEFPVLIGKFIPFVVFRKGYPEVHDPAADNIGFKTLTVGFLNHPFKPISPDLARVGKGLKVVCPADQDHRLSSQKTEEKKKDSVPPMPHPFRG
jgi:hypothetical protein